MYEKKRFSKKGKGIRKEREILHNCNMSGGAAKRAKRSEKAPAADDVNPLFFGEQRLPNVASSGQSVVAPPLAQVGEKRSLEPDNVKFDYDIEKKKLEIREKNLALYKQEQQAKLDFDTKQAEIETKNKDAEAEAYTKKKRADWLYKSYYKS